MKTGKIAVEVIRHTEAEAYEGACEAVLMYLFMKYCEGCSELDSDGLFEGIHGRTSGEGLFDGGPGKGRSTKGS